MYSSNSCFEFWILQLKKNLCPFFLFFFFKNSSVCPLSMFSICTFLRKFLHGLWSFSLKCARRLSQTQTPPKDFLQKLHPGVESPSSLDDATLECHHVSALWEVRWHSQTARRGEKQSLPAEANEDRLGNISTSLGMFGTEILVPCQSETRNCRSGMDVLFENPASMESAELAMGLLYGLDGFQNTGKLGSQCARLCVNFWSL